MHPTSTPINLCRQFSPAPAHPCSAAQVGHLKTLIILTGGCLFFGDDMPPKKLLGVGIAMAGIVWYTQV